MRGLGGFFVARFPHLRGALLVKENAYYQSISSERPTQGVDEIEITGADELSTATRRVCAGNDAHTEEAELGSAQSRESAID